MSKPKAIAKPPSQAPRTSKRDPIVESIESILALLRGVGPVLIGSSPNQAEITDLIAQLKDPKTKEEC